jgi:hypothetical protein
MGQDPFCLFRREITSDYGYDEDDDRKEQEYFDCVIYKEIKGISDAGVL